MTIDERIQSILTSGVATENGASGTLDISFDDLQDSQRYQDLHSAMVTTSRDEEDAE
jgi:hypothetical protein